MKVCPSFEILIASSSTLQYDFLSEDRFKVKVIVNQAYMDNWT